MKVLRIFKYYSKCLHCLVNLDAYPSVQVQEYVSMMQAAVLEGLVEAVQNQQDAQEVLLQAQQV